MDIKKLSDKELQDKIHQIYFAANPDYDLCSDLILEGLDRGNGFAKSVAADALYYEDHGFQKDLNLSWKYACEAHWDGWPMGAYVLAKFYRTQAKFDIAISLLEDIKGKISWADSLLKNIRAEHPNYATYQHNLDTNEHSRLDVFNYHLLKACHGNPESCRIVGDIISKVPAYGVMAAPSVWYEKGALCANPDPKCMFKTACNYTCQKRHKEAFNLYMKAYEAGYDRAVVQIAHALWFEIGVKRSDHIKEARKYFIKAVNLHQITEEPEYNRYLSSYYVVENFFKDTNSEGVSAEDWYVLGDASSGPREIRCYEKAAKMGLDKAKFEVARCYNNKYDYDRKYGSKKGDSDYLKKAIYWFRQASDSEREKELLELEKTKPVILRKKRRVNTSWRLKSTGKKIGFFVRIALFILAIVLIRRMDQMSYKPISEEQAMEMAREVKIAIPDQEIKLLDSEGSQTLKVGSTVKVLGIYKPQLNKGDSPLQLGNPCYLLQFADSTRGYGPLIETAIGQRTLLPEGDTATITAVKKVKKAPKVQATGETSQFSYSYTLEGRKQQYAEEDLNIISQASPQCVTYLGEGLHAEDFAPTTDTVSNFQSFIGKAKKFILYDICPVTKKNGFFLFPKYQKWNEFKIGGGFRTFMIWLAYIIEILLIIIILNRFFKGTVFQKAIVFLFFALVVIQFRRMDQMSYKPISEEQAMTLAQEVKITNPDQEVMLLDTDTIVTQTLKKKSIVKVLGVYKQRLNKGDSPLEPENRQYLILLPDGTRAYGPLAEEFSLPQGLTYLGEGLCEEDYTLSTDSISNFQTYLGKVKKFFLYDIRPVTKKNGFFLFPKYHEWNEFRLPYWLRITMFVLAYIIEITLILWAFSSLSFLIKVLKAKLGNARACFNIGIDHLIGSSRIEHDDDSALQWIRKSADKGHGRACAELGSMYENGRFFDVDLYLAKLYYDKGAAKGNRKCKKGAARMDDTLSWENNREFLITYNGAHRGNMFDQCKLGINFENGEYVQKNEKEAVRWYKKSADQGYYLAYQALGLCYAYGRGVNTDANRAIYFYKQGLANGDITNYARLGDLYYYGKGVPENHTTAVSYYRQGAEKGDWNSKFALGYCYYHGQGVTKSQSEGLRWMKSAAADDYQDAIDYLKELGITNY